MTSALAVFDVDGTLIDSRERIGRAMSFAYRKAGLPDPGFERTRTVVGLALREAFISLEPEASPALISELEAGYVEAFLALQDDASSAEAPYEGAFECLEALAGAGWRLAIATGKTRRGLDRLFAAHDIRGLFDACVCADDGPGKPHPFMIEESLRAAGARAGRAVMIGDAVHDMRMAGAAGVRAIGVSWGFGRPEEILEAGAHEVHDGFDSLRASLARFARESAP